MAVSDQPMMVSPKIEAPHKILHFDRIDSTNEEAFRQLRLGAQTPLWIIAREQIQGRGRNGRVWQSDIGNLYASYLFTARVSPAIAGQLSFVAALAVRDTILSQLPNEHHQRLTLKWPNDVYYDNAKLAGILLESFFTSHDTALSIILGIGINIAHSPKMLLDRLVTSLQEIVSVDATVVSPSTLFETLVNNLDRRIGQWHSGQCFDIIRAEWLTCAYGLGSIFTVDKNGTNLKGRFVGLEDTGAFKLELTPTQTVTINAGDVFLNI